MPQPTLHSRRLILRPFATSDIAVIARLANDPQIALNTARIRHPYTGRDARMFHATATARRQSDARDTGALLLTLRSNPEITVGCAGLHLLGERLIMGYWVARQFRKRGYAAEAAHALAMHAFEVLEFRQIHIACRVSNTGSRRVIEGLGSRFDGRRMSYSAILRRKVPVLTYVLTREGWCARAKLTGRGQDA